MVPCVGARVGLTIGWQWCHQLIVSGPRKNENVTIVLMISL